jgi:hypothetical protein
MGIAAPQKEREDCGWDWRCDEWTEHDKSMGGQSASTLCHMFIAIATFSRNYQGLVSHLCELLG